MSDGTRFVVFLLAGWAIGALAATFVIGLALLVLGWLAGGSA